MNLCFRLTFSWLFPYISFIHIERYYTITASRSIVCWQKRSQTLFYNCKESCHSISKSAKSSRTVLGGWVSKQKTNSTENWIWHGCWGFFLTSYLQGRCEEKTQYHSRAWNERWRITSFYENKLSDKVKESTSYQQNIWCQTATDFNLYNGNNICLASTSKFIFHNNSFYVSEI